MAQRTVPANELAIKALRCPEGKARVVYHIDGHGNDGLKLYVESSGTKTWYFRASSPARLSVSVAQCARGLPRQGCRSCWRTCPVTNWMEPLMR